MAENVPTGKKHLLSCLPENLITRIEHFGSTAVPNLAAKPIIDVMVGTTSLGKVIVQIVPILDTQGYEYFWRPTYGYDGPPFYAWFIKRTSQGISMHHLHIVEDDFQDHWESLRFRYYLIKYPEALIEYQSLKSTLVSKYKIIESNIQREKVSLLRIL